MGYLSTIPILCPYVSILSRFVEGRTMLPAIAISSPLSLDIIAISGSSLWLSLVPVMNWFQIQPQCTSNPKRGLESDEELFKAIT